MFTSIVFVDSRLTDYQALIAEISPSDNEIVVLDATRDGLNQMADALVGRSNLAAIHILSHGSAGEVLLGSTRLNAATLNDYSAQLAAIGQSLGADGDLLLYGCDVAAGDSGRSFIASVAQITQADVAASSDLTGSDGNWVLEQQSGVIETQPLQAPSWQGNLAAASLAANIYTSFNNSTPTYLTVFNNALYFQATDGTTASGGHGLALWKFDGTTASVVPGTDSLSPKFLTVFGANLYFQGIGAGGWELYKYDGTNVTLIDLVSGAGSSSPAEFVVFNGALYFQATGANGSELWKYDGSVATEVADIYALGFGSAPKYLTVFNNKLYFQANGGQNGAELWVYDGTNAPAEVADIYSGATGSTPKFLTVFNNALYFSASDGATGTGHGTELWKYDGTNAPSIVADSVSGSSGVNPNFLTVSNGVLYYQGTNSTNGMELWKYDGTNAPSVAVDIESGSGSSTPLYLANIGNKLYFSATTLANGREAWSFDGTTLTMVPDIFPNSDSSPQYFTALGSTLYFQATDNTNGTELFSLQLNSAPTFVGATTTLTVNENATATDITSLLHISDADTGQTVTWSQSVATNQSGTLTLSGATASSGTTDITPGGTITYAPATNYVGSETFTVQASDGTASTTRQISVTVNDVNPVISNTTFSVPENSANGTAVGTVTATDDTNGLTYAITAGNTSNVFAINTLTGAITVNGSLNYETANSYSLTVTVDDEDADVTADSTATITVNLTNVNETPSASNDAGSANEAGGTANGTAGSNAIGNVLSNDVDPDTGNNTGLTVTAVRTGGAEGAGTSGTLGNALAGSYGSLTLNSDGTFSYAINNSNATVQALSSGATLSESFNYTTSDGVLSDTAVLIVTINGANDSPTLDVSKTPVMGNVGEDATPSNGSTTGSTLVSALVDSGGSLNNFADPDGNSAGIAISGVNANGTLWYSTNGGSAWAQATGLSATNTLKLSADANTRVYFASSVTDYNGTISEAITFGTWDCNGGANGSIGGNTYTPIALSPVGSLGSLSNNRGVTVSGNYAYLTDGTLGVMKIVNITDPTSPTVTGTATPTSGFPQDVRVVGDYAYVTLWNSGLAIFNISNPAAPTQTGIISTVGAADSVAISGNYAYVADYSGGGGLGNLRVVDITNKSAPTLAATLSLTPGSPQDIVVVGTKAYIANGSSGLTVVDISTPTSPSVLGTYSGTVTAVAVSGDYAYLCMQTTVTVVNIAGSGNPSYVGSVTTGVTNSGIVLDGNYAYVAAGSAGLKLIDISAPSSPIVAGTLDTPSNAWNSALATGYVFVSDGTSMRAISRSGTAISSISATSDTAAVTVTPTADTPSVTNSTTNEDTQSSSGLVISLNAADDATTTHFKISSITGGILYKNDGTTQISADSFITFAQANAGLKFTPSANSNSNGSFVVQGSISAFDSGLGGSTATATITINPVGDTPSVTGATTNEDTQSSSGLVITRNAADSTEVTHFKISTIASGTLYKNDGTTQINDGDFITFAEGNAGLKFSPAVNTTTSGTFDIQSSRNGSTAEGVAATATVTITPIADTPAVTNAYTTPATQTTSGLVLTRNAADSTEVTHFQITGITNGNLFKADGITAIVNNDFITYAEGHVGLKFTPTGGGNGSFTAQASTSNAAGGLGGSTVSATISLGMAISSPSAIEDATSSTVTITQGGSETHYKITGISGGTLFTDASLTTAVPEGGFVSAAGATTSLYFVPAADRNSTTGGNGTFTAQASNDGTSVTGSTVTSTITLVPVADTPSVASPSATEDTDTGAIAITRAAGDGAETTHYKVTGITSGTLYSDAAYSTAINNNDFIASAGATTNVYFRPIANANSTTGGNGAFTVQASKSNVDGGLGGSTATSTITLAPAADTPAVTNTSTNEDTQSASGLVLTRSANDGAETTHFKITGITGGTLYKTDGTSAVVNGDFITFAEGNAGLKFTPTANSNAAGAFTAQASSSGVDGGLAGSTVNAAITVTPVADTPAVTNANTPAGTQTTSGLVLSRNAADSTEVTHFKITGITNGNLFQSDGTTAIANGDFITFAEGNAGLKFTPSGSSNGSFTAKASTSNADGGLGGAAIDASITIGQPSITSATYDVATHTLAVTGANIPAVAGATNDIDVTKLTLFGEGGDSVTLSGSNLEIASATSFSVALSGAANLAMETLFNKNGLTSSGGTSYNLAAATGWAPGYASTPADLTGNLITVSNVLTPSITSATYDAATGALVVTGMGLLKLSGATNDIVVSKFAFTGEGGATYTLTDSVNVEITSGTAFTITLSATDLAAVNQIVNKNLTSSTGGTTYNLAAAEDWAAGADAAVVVADLTGNGMTVSNVAVPTITSATYNTETGVLVVTGTGFLQLAGASNDIDITKLGFTGQGGSGTSYTLTSASGVEITSATSFSVTLSGSEKTAANALLNKSGLSATDNTTYNLAAAEDWAAGADAAVVVADLTGNAMDVTANTAPTITSGSTGSVAENEATSTAVYSATATDIDPGTILTYSLTGTDASAFDIGSGTGVVTLRASADFEAKSSYVFNVVATDDGTGNLSDTKAVTISIADVVESVDPVPTPITIDGATGSTLTTTTGTQTTTTQTIAPVSAARVEDQSTANITLADIPLATDSSGTTLVQLSLPVGVGVTSNASTTVTGGTAPTLREQLVTASNAHVGDSAQLLQIIANGIDQYVPTVTDSSQVTVRTITLTVPAGTTTAPSEPIHITGATGTGESDLTHPLRQEALVIDASQLPSGSVLDLDNVEFAVLVGPVTATGGAGRNYVIGDGSAQTIVLGADDDILHGGAGNDTVGSKGGNDQLFGDDGNDTVVGGLGDDHLEGGAGDDLLVGSQSDAGQFTFSQIHDQFNLKWVPNSTDLADSSGFSLPGNYTGGTPLDPRLAFGYQTAEMRETIAELYQAYLHRLPSVQEMNYWCTSGSTVAELNQGVGNLIVNPLEGQSTQQKVTAVLSQIWGADKVTPELVQIGSDYINAGGTWGRVVQVLIGADTFKTSMLSTDGSMTLTQQWSLADSGWASDTGADTLLGGAGDDTLVGGHGNDVLDGGDGVDTALWFGQAGNFEVQMVGSGTTKDVALVDTATGEVDIIRNMEQVQIGGVNFDATKLETLANVEAYLASHTDHHLEVVLVGLAGLV